MELEIISLRPFIGSKNYDASKLFYAELGFEERTISDNMSLFQRGKFSFYLQDSYIEDWINNTMLFIEVEDVKSCFDWLTGLNLAKKYPGAKLVPIKKDYWGEECFVLDPSGVLLHFGQFNKTA